MIKIYYSERKKKGLEWKKKGGMSLTVGDIHQDKIFNRCVKIENAVIKKGIFFLHSENDLLKVLKLKRFRRNRSHYICGTKHLWKQHFYITTSLDEEKVGMPIIYLFMEFPEFGHILWERMLSTFLAIDILGLKDREFILYCPNPGRLSLLTKLATSIFPQCQLRTEISSWRGDLYLIPYLCIFRQDEARHFFNPYMMQKFTNYIKSLSEIKEEGSKLQGKTLTIKKMHMYIENPGDRKNFCDISNLSEIENKLDKYERWEPWAQSFQEQVETAQKTKLLIAPTGNVSCIAPFMNESSTFLSPAIFIDPEMMNSDYKIQRKITLEMINTEYRLHRQLRNRFIVFPHRLEDQSPDKPNPVPLKSISTPIYVEDIKDFFSCPSDSIILGTCRDPLRVIAVPVYVPDVKEQQVFFNDFHLWSQFRLEKINTNLKSRTSSRRSKIHFHIGPNWKIRFTPQNTLEFKSDLPIYFYYPTFQDQWHQRLLIRYIECVTGLKGEVKSILIQGQARWVFFNEPGVEFWDQWHMHSFLRDEIKLFQPYINALPLIRNVDRVYLLGSPEHKYNLSTLGPVEVLFKPSRHVANPFFYGNGEHEVDCAQGIVNEKEKSALFLLSGNVPKNVHLCTYFFTYKWNEEIEEKFTQIWSEPKFILWKRN